jgi:hypothetical protein
MNRRAFVTGLGAVLAAAIAAEAQQTGKVYRATHEVRTRHQPQDRQSPRPTIPPSLLLRADQVIE